jgi:hypothetical protein
MSDKPYGLFCPIAKACEVLEPLDDANPCRNVLRHEQVQ